jgi:hypothetical protein
MKKFIAALFAVFVAQSASANVDCIVKGYVTAAGTSVHSYVRTQTRCVTTQATTFAPGNALAVLSILTLLNQELEKNINNKNNVLEKIVSQDHKIYTCDVRDRSDKNFSRSINFITGGNIAVSFYNDHKFVSNIYEADDGKFKMNKLMSTATFDPATAKLTGTGILSSMYSDCALMFEQTNTIAQK